MPRFSPLQLTLGLLVLLAAALFWQVGSLQEGFLLLTRESWDRLHAYQQAEPFLFCLIFFLSYSLLTAMLLPVSLPLKLLAGSLFGFGPGTLIVGLASTLAAIVNFLLVRYFLYARVQRRYGEALHKVNEGIRRDGWFYLLALRLLPILPAQAVTVIMGMVPISASVFILVTLFGSLPVTAAYVYLGSTLPALALAQPVLPPELILGSIALLGASWLGKRWWEKRHQA